MESPKMIFIIQLSVQNPTTTDLLSEMFHISAKIIKNDLIIIDQLLKYLI